MVYYDESVNLMIIFMYVLYANENQENCIEFLFFTY